MEIELRKPGIQILLKKNVGRKTVAGSAPLSQRYAGSGGVVDLTQYLGEHGSVRVQKSVRGGAGAFSIAFPDNIDIGILDSLYALIEPMDTLEIYMAGNAYQYAGVGLPIMMRGFVSTIQRQRGMSPDGKPTRTVVVSGQDYGKILQILQIFNMPFSADVAAQVTNFPFFTRFGFSQRPQTVETFLQTVFNMIVNPYLALMRENADGSTNTQSPLLQISLDIQNDGDQVSPFGTGGWNTGTMESLIQQFTDIGAFCEFFIEDRVDGPWAVFRSNPFQDAATGAYIFDDLKTPPSFIPLVSADIVTMSSERSDANVANYFWVESPRFLYNHDSTARAVSFQSAQQGGPQTVYMTGYGNNNPNLYGIRKLEETTQIAGGSELYNGMGLNGLALPTSASVGIDWVTKRREQLIAQNLDNVVFETGSMHIKGNELVKAGTYAQLTEGIQLADAPNMVSQYYVDSVTHDYEPYGNYFTTAQFSRGTGFIVRSQRSQSQNSPYWAEITRGNGL
jgi:hypothetical protein